MRLRPIPPRVVQPAPQQQLAEAMATPLQVLARVIARPGQIAHGLVGRRRRLHDRQQSRAPELGQFAGIAPIRLHALAGLPRHQGGGDHVARDPVRHHLPLQRVPARAGFVEHLHGPRRVALQLAHHAPHRPGSLASCHVTGVGAARSASRRRGPSCAHRFRCT